MDHDISRLGYAQESEMLLTINSARLWARLMQMAEIGATPKGGCNRQTLTDLDMQGRALFARWCSEINLSISTDAIGNMFAQMQGANNSLPPLILGSHLDTQPTGGKYDGVLGVLAALEAVTRLHEEGITPPRPVEIANWTNEEGARFAPAMMGSGVWAGVLDMDAVRRSADAEGITLGQELDRHRLSGHPHISGKEIFAYLELHIEQGPVLEQAEAQIGVVTGAQGIRWYDIALTGAETHAGPTPMAMRSDPMKLVPELVAGIFRIGQRDSAARTTIGQFQAHPGSRNVVPGQISISVDLRHPDEATLTTMDAELEALITSLAGQAEGIGAELTRVWHSPVIAFDARLVEAVRHAAKVHRLPHRDIVSGAGHDALMVARKAPTAMIFIPCRNGISHNEAEHIEPEQAEAGANVLLGAALGALVDQV